MGAQRIIIILMLLILGIFAGCSSSGDSGPTLPSPGGTQGGDYEGDQDEPPIPTPYAELRENRYLICDMEWELDGDLVVSTYEAGIFLYTPYGLLKRQYDIPCVFSLQNNDTGRGMSFSGGSCNPDGIDDDIYVSEGHNTVTFDALWYSGDPSPTPDMCDLTITMQWMCAGMAPPLGYSYHPFSGRTYIKLNSGGVWIGDGECEMDWHPDIGSTVDPGALCGAALGDVILSYDQMAPFLPFNIWFTGPPDEPLDPAGDWVIYTVPPVYNCIQTLAAIAPGYQRMANTTLVFSANGTDPPG